MVKSWAWVVVRVRVYGYYLVYQPKVVMSAAGKVNAGLAENNNSLYTAMFMTHHLGC